MDSAANALGKFLTGSGKDNAVKDKVQDGNQSVAEATAGGKDVTVDQEVKPAVEHQTIKKQHETEEQKVIDRERHQHHYHTSVQPLQDKEVAPTKHDSKVTATEERDINNDDKAESVKAKHDDLQAGFKNTTEQAATQESYTKKETLVESNNVHHHLHETIQPVIEKEVIQPSITHKTIPVHEVVHEQTKDHGVTQKKAISVDEFKHRLDGEGGKTSTQHDGKPTIGDETAVTSKPQ